jgi:hypothetical protein
MFQQRRCQLQKPQATSQWGDNGRHQLYVSTRSEVLLHAVSRRTNGGKCKGLCEGVHVLDVRGCCAQRGNHAQKGKYMYISRA